ncbi:MAG: hypothetical protein HBSAPP03_21220 [Phycisphaerae bacterium]|nr:MAG: hypothetical protein HBSAPP03_21220 [Phycisphaerae bacterium]
MLTLWDLIEPVVKVFRSGQSIPAARRAPRRRPTTTPRHVPGRGVRERYEAVARELLATHGIRVRKWRRSSSGVAVVLTYRDGSVRKYIECPRPRGPMSMAIFLHEVGHHVIGVGTVSPRCLEELRAWQFAIAEMERRGLNITQAVRRRMDRSLRYAVGKAARRGIQSLPPELRAYAA